MRLRYFTDASQFQSATRDWMERDEYRHSLALSILATAIRCGKPIEGWFVQDDSGPRAAILQTVPSLLCVVGTDAESTAWAAEHVDADFSHVTGAAETVEPFARRWAARHQRTAILELSMTFYVLKNLDPFADPGGTLRLAVPEELERIAALNAVGAEEMKLPEVERVPDLARERVQRAIAEQRQYVWVCGSEIRAIAVYSPSLPDRGARIGMVYTLPEFRGRGYGAAITGSLARLLMRGGQRWVSLFADDLNPTSTAVYRRLGFQPNHSAQTWRISGEG
jgi:ribosomal protein S18 acetylase RimI-like enzyme